MFIVTLTAMTTEGPHTNVSDPMPLGDAQDNVAGIIAALGEENVISITLSVVVS